MATAILDFLVSATPSLEASTKEESSARHLAIVVDGERVVDLCEGHTDKTRAHEWAEDTLVNVYSTTQG